MISGMKANNRIRKNLASPDQVKMLRGFNGSVSNKQDFALDRQADLVNRLAAEVNDRKRKFHYELMRLFEMVRAAGYSFASWSAIHLRRPDGTQWNISTLYAYIQIARDPDRFQKMKKASERRNLQRAFGAKRHNSLSDKKQAEALFMAWEKTSEKGKTIFLDMVEKSERSMAA